MVDYVLVPPNDRQYHRVLEGKSMHLACNGLQAFKILDKENKHEVVFSLLVKRKLAHAPSLSELKESCTSLSLIPLNMLSYQGLTAVLHRPFKTFRVHTIRTTDFLNKPCFVDILRGWIKDLNSLRSRELSVDSDMISALTLVVLDDTKCGGFLYIPPIEMKATVSGTEDLARLIEVVLKLAGIKLGEMTNPSLKTLFQCLILAKGPSRRARILYSPYLLTDLDKVFKLIPKVYSAAAIPGEYYDNFQNLTNMDGWGDEMFKAENKVFYDIYLYNKKDYNLLCPFSFLVYLRCCVEHLGKVQSVIVGEWTLKSGPDRFLKFINEIRANFLDELFLMSYVMKDSKIPLFDRD